MLERLCEAHYRRRFGPEKAELVLRIERAMAAMPQTEKTERWSEWVWSLPPEAWEEAVALRRTNVDLVDQREEAVKLITRKNRLKTRSPGSPEAVAAEEAFERFKANVIRLEEADRGRRRHFRERWGEPPE